MTLPKLTKKTGNSAPEGAVSAPDGPVGQGGSRIVRIAAAGAAPQLMRVAPPEQPGPGEVLLRMKAAALNFADLLMVEGRYQDTPPFPFTAGLEGAGVVEAAGAGVSAAADGSAASVAVVGGAVLDVAVVVMGQLLRGVRSVLPAARYIGLLKGAPAGIYEFVRGRTASREFFRGPSAHMQNAPDPRTRGSGAFPGRRMGDLNPRGLSPNTRSRRAH